MSANNSNGKVLSNEMRHAVEMYFAQAGRGFRYIASYRELKELGLSEDDIKASILTGFLAFGKKGYALSRRTLAEIGILEKNPRGLNDDDSNGQLPVYKSEIGAYMAGLVDAQGLNPDYIITCGEVEKAIGKYHSRRLKKNGHFRLASSGLYRITEKSVKQRILGEEF